MTSVYDIKLQFLSSTLLKVNQEEMERIQFDYSYKNIPIPSEHNFRLQLIEKMELVIKRMRWKAYFYEANNNEEDNAESEVPNNYGLKTLKCPPQNNNLIPFENELFEMVRSLKFRKTSDEFQRRLQRDIKTINETTTTLTFADKTTNMYKLSKDEHDKLLTNAVTSTYKKSDTKTEKQIIKEGKKLVKNKTCYNRMFINSRNNAFITLKDHKENFQNNPKVRLLNPAKNELGRISKGILDKVNKELKSATQINQWISTKEVIEWFKSIPDKQKHKFVVFDIKDFYPSIKMKLLNDALNFAKQSVEISEDDERIIHHAHFTLPQRSTLGKKVRRPF